jgi:hypothetical protein
MTTDLARFNPAVDIIEHLDRDSSLETVVQEIGGLVQEIADRQWMIGYILLFLRYRAEFSDSVVFEWTDEKVWPPELYEFIKQRFGKTLSGMTGEMTEFIHWSCYRYDAEGFWILARPGEIRVWIKGTTTGLTEDAYEDFVSNIADVLRGMTVHRDTLANYYRTAACFPPSKIEPLLAWTIHFEVGNLAGGEVDEGLTGIDRLEAKAEIAQQKLKQLLQEYERLTVTVVRQLQADNQRERLGFRWLPPAPTRLLVQTGDAALNGAGAATGLTFVNHDDPDVAYAIRSICWYADCGPWAKNIKLIIKGDSLELPDGRQVATFNGQDMDIEPALSWLANKMKWEVHA